MTLELLINSILSIILYEEPCGKTRELAVAVAVDATNLYLKLNRTCSKNPYFGKLNTIEPPAFRFSLCALILEYQEVAVGA